MHRRGLFTIYGKGGNNMNFSAGNRCVLLGVGLVVACAPMRSSNPPTPIAIPPSPGNQLPTVAVPGAGLWVFKYQPGSAGYQISRTATIARIDTVGQTEVSTNASHELITLDSTDVGIDFVVVIDGFTTTTQGLIGPVQPAQLPVQISGSFTPSGLNLRNSAGEKCSPVHSAVFSDLYNLFVVLPQPLAAGTRWTDSVDIRSCPAGVPALSHTVRMFTVAGETTYDGRPVVMVQRADTTIAQGEGGLQQHRLSIDAHGTGTAVYYLDVASGRILHLTVSQTLTLGVVTSSRQYRLKQDSKQDFGLLR